MNFTFWSTAPGAGAGAGGGRWRRWGCRPRRRRKSVASLFIGCGWTPNSMNILNSISFASCTVCLLCHTNVSIPWRVAARLYVIGESSTITIAVTGHRRSQAWAPAQPHTQRAHSSHFHRSHCRLPRLEPGRRFAARSGGCGTGTLPLIPFGKAHPSRPSNCRIVHCSRDRARLRSTSASTATT